MNEVSPYFILRDKPSPQRDAFHSRWDSEPNLREYWSIIRKHQWLLVSTSLAAGVLAFVWFITRVPIYRATATIMIQPQAPQVLDMRELLAEQTPDQEHDYYKTQYDILMTRSLAARVIHQLGLQSNPNFKDDRSSNGTIAGIIETLRKLVHNGASAKLRATEAYGVKPEIVDKYLAHLAIEPPRGTRLVIVGFSTPDPSLSAQIANAHVEAYIRQEMEIHAQAGHDAEEFLQQKLLEIRDKVEKSEAALNDYKRKRGIVTEAMKDPMKPEESEPLLQRMNELNTELSKASGNRIKLETLHQLVKKGHYDSLPDILNNPVIQKLKEDIAKLSRSYASMSNRFNEGYHPLDDLKVRLDDAERKMQEEMRKVAEGVDTEYQAAVAYETNLTGEIGEVRSQAAALNDASLQYAILDREVSANQQLYKQVLDRMNELKVSSDVPATNISIVDPAPPPLHPMGPSLASLMILSLALGLFGGIGIATFLESLDDGFKNNDEVNRYLGLPTLGLIPDLRKLNSIGAYGYLSNRRKTSEDEHHFNGVAPKNPAGDLLVMHDRLTVAGEFYKIVRNGIMFSKAGGSPRSIMITSAHPGEGKTVTAINIASAFAQIGGRVLLVDTDLRRPRCHALLQLQLHQGLTEVLVGKGDLDEVIQATKVRGLYLLSAGTLPPNPGELLASEEMKALVGRMLTEFEYVFLDATPILPVSDPVGLGRMIDGVLIVAARNTSKRLVWEACERISHAGAKILGVVLNRVESYGFPNPQYRQYYPSSGPTGEHSSSSFDAEDIQSA